MLPKTLILIAPFDAFLTSQQSCITDSFYGSFNGQSVFNISPTCFEAGIPELDSGNVIPIFRPIQQLVWIQKQSVDEALWNREDITPLSALDQLFNRLSTLEPSSANSRVYGEQQAFIASETDKQYEILYRTSSSALLSLDPGAARTIDTILPPFYKSTLLPTSPVSYVPVPDDKVEILKGLLSSLKFDPVVASIVNSISIPQMKRDIRYLTGEDKESPIISRHSFAAGARVAAAWLKEHFEATGATCELKHFLSGFAPNVIWCEHCSSQISQLLIIYSIVLAAAIRQQ
jgi:hypothetical protein